jgi:hypothetical protein
MFIQPRSTGFRPVRIIRYRKIEESAFLAACRSVCGKVYFSVVSNNICGYAASLKVGGVAADIFAAADGKAEPFRTSMGVARRQFGYGFRSGSRGGRF